MMTNAGIEALFIAQRMWTGVANMEISAEFLTEPKISYDPAIPVWIYTWQMPNQHSTEILAQQYLLLH